MKCFSKFQACNTGTDETNDNQGFLQAGLRMLHNPKLLEKKAFVESPHGYLRAQLMCTRPIALKFHFTLLPTSPERVSVTLFYYSVLLNVYVHLVWSD